MRKFISALLVFCLISGLMAGCGRLVEDASIKDGPTEKPRKSSNDKGTDLEAFDDSIDAVITEEPRDYSAYELEGIGSAEFTVAGKNRVSLDFTPLGEDAVLELEDQEGRTWRLTIPARSLKDQTTITMTELTDVSTDAFSSEASGGILLEPDGLVFLEPAILEVEGLKQSRNSFVLTAAQDGSDLEFGSILTNEESLKAELFHFSSVFSFTVDGPNLVELQKISEQQYKEAVKAARDLLKEPIEMPPPPPDIKLKCGGDAARRLGGIYYKRILQPEEPVIIRLMSAGRNYSLLGGEKDDSLYYAGELLKRNVKKVTKLIRTYKPDPDKLAAVAYAGLRVGREVTLLGGDAQSFFVEFSDWAAKVAEQFLDELRNDHDYRAASGLIEMARLATLLDGTTDVVSIEEVAKALSFKVDFDVSCYVGAGEQRMTLKGSVDVTSHVDDKGNLSFGVFVGKGKGEYVTYSTNSPASTTIDFPNKYDVNMRFVEFNPCEGEMKLIVDKIGSDKEVWYNPDLDERFYSGTDMDLFVQTLTEQLFGEFLKSDAMPAGDGKGYVFPFAIYNMQGEMCRESIVKTGNINTFDGSIPASIAYNVTITHDPK